MSLMFLDRQMACGKQLDFFLRSRNGFEATCLLVSELFFKTNTRVFFYFLRVAEILTEFESKTGSESDIAVSGRSLCDAACCLHI